MKQNLLIFSIIGLLFVSLFSCKQEQEQPSDLTPWYGKKTMKEQFKWYSKGSNYFDSNYTERFYPMYYQFLAKQQTDSALYYLLVFSEMIDQNYIFDTVYLNTTKNHLAKYESENTHNNEILKLYYYIASTYYTASIIDSCERWALLGLSKEHMPKRFQAKCHRTLSEMYRAYSKVEEAIPHVLAFLSYFEEKKDTLNIGVAYSNLGSLYKELFAYETAENYYKKALNYSLLKKDTLTIATYYQLLCNLYHETNRDSSQFIFYANQLNDIIQKKSDPELYLLSVNEDISIMKFFLLNQLDSIPNHLQKYEVYSHELGDSVSLKNYMMHKVRFELKKNHNLPNIDKLEQFAEQAFKRQEFIVGINLYSTLFENATKDGNYKKALEYQDKIGVLKKVLYEKNNKGQLYDKELQYQTKLKDQQLEIQEENLRIKERNIGLLLALIIIIILSIFIYVFIQKQKELKQKQKNESIFTRKLLESTEEERKRIARDLHDSVGHELLNVKNSIQNKLQGNEEKIDQILLEVREISRNLFPAMFQEIGLKICVEQMVNSLMKTDDLFIDTEITYKEGTLNPNDEINIYRIIQEALSNVRKYAEAQSAKVCILQNSNEIEVKIMDNGKGFSVDNALKSGKAFGLISIMQRCKLLNADAEFVSNENGTNISFKFKVQ